MTIFNILSSPWNVFTFRRLAGVRVEVEAERVDVAAEGLRQLSLRHLIPGGWKEWMINQ